MRERWLPLDRQPRWPGPCVVCRQWDDHAFCTACIDRFARSPPRCARCGDTTALALPACGRCLHEPPPFTRTVCAVDYAFPWAEAIADFKFHGRVELAGALAGLLADAVRRHGDARPDVVLPVPLSEQRQAERGYNQAWELARRLARRLGLQAHAQLLLRHLDTPHQVALGRNERQHNLRRAFMVEPRQQAIIRGRRVALVDDVMTTGATLSACSHSLLRAGASAVEVWVLARTPTDPSPH
jgi:ComF family protein